MSTRNAGRGVLSLVFVALALGLAFMAVARYTEAAGLTPPIGFIVRRDCANYALGRIFASKGAAVGSTEVTITGMLATDHIIGLVNLTDPTETQIGNASLTAASGKVTAASGLANSEHYLCIYLRPLQNGQTSW